MARILYLDPYHGPSHAALSTTLRDHCRHQVTLLTLPARKWKWRMRGAALAFEPAVRDLSHPPDILVTTDMLNLPEFLTLLRDVLPACLRVITYFHENQMTYPLASRDERDFHFGLANLYTALASDRVVFNSRFHRQEFLDAVPGLIRKMPDQRPKGLVDRIRARSHVLGPPVDAKGKTAKKENIVLWNHRWEQDKNPEAFFRVMVELDRQDLDFRIMVLGQAFQTQPACFAAAKRRLARRIVHWGYVPSRAAYLEMVARCRFVVSTAHHEFYGLAVREAIAAGCYPLLPRRVVYPELVGDRPENLYDSEQGLVGKLAGLLADTREAVSSELIEEVSVLTPDRVAAQFDAWFDELT